MAIKEKATISLDAQTKRDGIAILDGHRRHSCQVWRDGLLSRADRSPLTANAVRTKKSCAYK